MCPIHGQHSPLVASRRLHLDGIHYDDGFSTEALTPQFINVLPIVPRSFADGEPQPVSVATFASLDLYLRTQHQLFFVRLATPRLCVGGNGILETALGEALSYARH